MERRWPVDGWTRSTVSSEDQVVPASNSVSPTQSPDLIEKQSFVRPNLNKLEQLVHVDRSVKS